MWEISNEIKGTFEGGHGHQHSVFWKLIFNIVTLRILCIESSLEIDLHHGRGDTVDEEARTVRDTSINRKAGLYEPLSKIYYLNIELNVRKGSEHPGKGAPFNRKRTPLRAKPAGQEI